MAIFTAQPGRMASHKKAPHIQPALALLSILLLLGNLRHCTTSASPRMGKNRLASYFSPATAIYMALRLEEVQLDVAQYFGLLLPMRSASSTAFPSLPRKDAARRGGSLKALIVVSTALPGSADGPHVKDSPDTAVQILERVRSLR